MSRKQLTIGLFGLGCVGQGLFEVLEKTPTLKTNIKKICVKNRSKKRLIPSDYITFDKYEILNDEEINVVVELIDDADAAFEIVSYALKQGKAVVSANKKMIAEHFNELLELQKNYNAPFLYEAACCASIPIIRNLEEYYDNDLLDSIEGIINGSTNYILTKVYEENISYKDALLEAQEKGYAESNPILDTGGFDAKYKLLILLAHAFGYVANPDEIVNIGIDQISTLAFKYAQEKGLKIKLIAQATRDEWGKLTAFVMPKFISRDDKLFSVDDVFNGVKTKSCFSDTQFFSGKGAGAYPTASAVLSDISALSYDYRYEYKKLSNNDFLKPKGEVLLKVFLKHQNEDSQLIKNYFEEIEELFANLNEGYFIGNISLQNLDILLKNNHFKNLSIVLFDVDNANPN